MELSLVLYLLIYVASIMRDYVIILFTYGESCHLQRIEVHDVRRKSDDFLVRNSE